MSEVQTPSAPANPAPAAPAAPASGGMFDNLEIIEPQAQLEKPPLDQDPLATPKEPVLEAVDGKPSEPAASAAPVTLLAGRFKTPQELEKAYQESSGEGLRLYQESRALQGEIKSRDEKIAELELAIKMAQETPAFREMSPEELKELAQTDPVKAAEYVADKKLRERDAAQSKKERAAELARQKQETDETERHIESRIQSMEEDAENYPDYDSLKPLQMEISKRTGNELSGKKWSADFLYYAAYGYKALQAHRSGKTAAAEADRKAKAQAAAAAAAGGSKGPGPAGQAPGAGADQDSDAAFMDRVMKAGSRPLF